MINAWCKTCQLEHSTGHCPVVASTVEQIEGYQQHLERKFWEQAYCAALSIEDLIDPGECADAALEAWRERWGKK